MTSKKYSLNWIDAGKGAITGGLASVLMLLQTTADSGVWTFHWKSCSMAFISGFAGYLIKNYFSAPKEAK